MYADDNLIIIFFTMDFLKLVLRDFYIMADKFDIYWYSFQDLIC